MAPYLGTDLSLSTSKIITKFSKHSSSIQDESKKIEKIENYIKDLEEERRKIEVFNRELPLCTILLDDVICGMKGELENYPKNDEKDEILEGEELMPIKSKHDCKDEKMNWLSSAQLWSNNNHTNGNNNDNNFNAINNKNSKKNTEIEDESSHRLQSLTSAFVPFRGMKKEAAKVTGELPELSLLSGAAAIVPIEGPKLKGKCHVSSNGDGHVRIQSPQQQGPRKARRSWSRDLHRRFVVALHQLGGAQVATPKMIREVMKVDDLTNDEVKSHLQKYRLNARRASSSSSSTNQPLAITEGLWAAREQQHAISQQSASYSASPEGPFQLALSLSRAMSASLYEDGKSESHGWL